MLAHHQKKKAQWNPVMEMWGVYFPLERSSLKNSFAQLNRSKITFLIPSRKPKTKQILKSYILQSHPIKTSIQNQNTLVGIKSYLNLVDGVPSYSPQKWKKKRNKTPTSNTKDLPTKIFQVVWLFSFLSKNQKCSTSLRFSVHLEVFGCLHAADTMCLLEPQHSCGGWSPIPCNFMSNSQLEKTISLTLPKLGCENDFLDFSI